MLVRALEEAGLGYDDIEPVYVTNAGDARAAFQSGRVDAVGLWDPFLAGAELTDAPRMLRDGTGLSNNRTFYFASPGYLAAEAEVIRIVFAQLRLMEDWAQAHPDAVAELLAPQLGVPVPVLRLATGRPTRLSEIGTLDPHAFGLFLNLLGEALSEQAGPEAAVERQTGDGLLRTLDLLATHLPEDLWITSLELEHEDPPGVAKDKGVKRPVLVVDGSGKSRGTRNVDDAYTSFVQAVQSLPEKADERPAEMVETQNPGREKFEFRLKLSYLAPQKPPPTEDDDADAEAGGR